jgi:hypothetical protein
VSGAAVPPVFEEKSGAAATPSGLFGAAGLPGRSVSGAAVPPVFEEKSGAAATPSGLFGAADWLGRSASGAAVSPVSEEKSGAAAEMPNRTTASSPQQTLNVLPTIAANKDLKTDIFAPDFEKIRCPPLTPKHRPVLFAYLGAEMSELPVVDLGTPQWLSAGAGAEWASRRHVGWGLRGEAWFHQFEALPLTITSVQRFGPEKERITRYDSVIMHRNTRVAANAQLTRRFGRAVLLGGVSGGWVMTALTEYHERSETIDGQVFSTGVGYRTDQVPEEVRRFYLGLKVGVEYHPLPRWVLGATLYRGLNDVVRSPRYNVANDVLFYLGYKF